jgi:exodeoxyribonuclease-3
MKIISFNVNGIRAIAKKGFADTVKELDPDILCLQETKATPEQVKEALGDVTGYHIFANSAERKGYSGTAILTKEEPVRLDLGIGTEEHDQEGRVITANFPGFSLVNAYVPNSGNGLARLPYRKQWDAAMNEYLNEIRASRPVVYVGDMNVAHREIDIARPKPNYNKTAGFTQTEIDGMDNYIASGLVDSFRALNPDEVKYSWWSYRAGARGKNIGWRIDYCLLSEELMPKVTHAFILNDVLGSDHCPVGVEIDI